MIFRKKACTYYAAKVITEMKTKAVFSVTNGRIEVYADIITRNPSSVSRKTVWSLEKHSSEIYFQMFSRL